jgi:hypothetical protein
MTKKKLILLPSSAMDKNKKEGRDENNLIRMSKKARQFMKFSEEQVEVWSAGTTAKERKSSAILLNIFQAYSDDIKKLKNSKSVDMDRVGFVTTKVWNRVTNGKDEQSIWVSTGVHDTVIGADPEFLIFDSDGNVIRANNLMSKTGILGCDGAMAEIRPEPSVTPGGLIKNIKSIFSNKDLTAPISKYDWIAGCYYKDNVRDYPMGGHIHIGNPLKVARMTLNKREIFFNVLNKVMDELLAIPCIRLDNGMGNKRRTQCQMSNTGGWGYFGEWRTCDGRLEHRTLSGMWLMHPSLAKCVIGTAKAITDDVFKKWASKNFNHEYIVPKKYADFSRDQAASFNDWHSFTVCKDTDTCMSSKELKAILNSSKSSDIDKTYLSNWHNKMRRLSTYNKYSKYIDGLKEILTVPIAEVSKWNKNIKENWLDGKKFAVDV